jgi:DNA polymerase III subunit gamma/tau
VSLYRTWRPKSFADLVGQDAVVRTLRTALSSGKLAHAYLFSGPRGSGKTSAAKILARCVNCVRGPTPDPDNTCEHCVAILAGTSLDVVELDAASNGGIDRIRDIREAVKFAPAQMRYKVYILDEAHGVTGPGAEAFLKTLEEPPAHAIFILATTAPEKLPLTILSRCQRYAFRRIPVATMIERMRVIAVAEGIEIDEAALAAIAYRADGGLRDALTMLEQVAAFSGGPVDVAAVDAAFGASGRAYARAIVTAVLSDDAAASLQLIDDASEAGTDMQGLLRGVLAEYRNLLVARLNRELLARDLSPADAEAVGAVARATPQPRIVRGVRVFGDAFAAARTTNPRLELETAVMRLVVQGEDPSLEALATRVTLLEQADASSRRGAETPLPAEVEPVAEPAATPPPAPGVLGQAGKDGGAVAEVTLQRVRSLWQSIRTRAEGDRVPLRAPLSRASVDALEGDVLTIRLVDASMESYVRDHAAIIERAIADVLEVPLRLRVRVDRQQSRSAHRAAPAPVDAEGGSGEADAGEIDLLDYATKRIGRTERR